MTFSVPGYQVEQLLGYGSQAEVWSGQVAGSSERVALKRIPVESAGAAAAARAEAALLAALDHPNLIRLREFVPLRSAVVLVLELAEAGSLKQLLQRRGRLSQAEVIATISPVAAALAHAHEAGVLHADVSAANILFNAAGQPKLADLGIARLLLGPSQAIGTPAYLDPSIAAGGAAGAASDVFSLAAVALHALTGCGRWAEPGGSERDADQTLAVAATGQICDLPGRLRDVEPQLAEVLVRALDPQPQLRPTAVELALDLRAALTPAPVVLAGGRIAGKVGRHSVERQHGIASGRAAGRAPAGQQQAGSQPAGPRPPGQQQAGSQPAGPRPPGQQQAGSQPAGLQLPGRLPGDQVPADLTRVARPQVRASLAAAPPPVRRLNASRAGLGGSLRLVRRPLGHGRRSDQRPQFALAARLIRGRRPGRIGMLAGSAAAAAVVLLLVGVPGRFDHRASAAPESTSTAQVDPLAILQGLDAIRARAYATRQPDLLRQVYASPSLLAQDTAQLARTVPAGCQLIGLHTGYRDVSVRPAGTYWQIRESATLSSAALVCNGAVRSHTAAAGPVTLTVTVTGQTPSRIIAEQAASS